jgi:hypothetical protein
LDTDFIEFRSHPKRLSWTNFLNANETLLNIPSADTIVKLREKHEQAFTRFRFTLLEIVNKLQGVPPDQFAQRSEQLYHTDILPQTDEIKKMICTIGASLTKGTLVSLGGVAFAIASGTALPLIAAILYASSGALTEALPALSDYMTSRNKPEFIWNIMQK